MSFYPLSSVGLRQAADLAFGGSGSLFDSQVRARQQWEEDFSSFSSVAFEAAFGRFGSYLAGLSQPASALDRIGQILQLTAVAQQELETHLVRVQAVGARLSPGQEAVDSNPFINAIIDELRVLGRALDRACAEAIDLAIDVCTPQASSQALSLADNADSSVEEIHRVNLAVAPPIVREKLRSYPQATLLEVGPDTAVVAFGNVDEASEVITMVAGVGSSAPGSFDGEVGRAQRLHQQTGAATVMWLGYRAPASVPVALAAEPARTGGTALREFQASLAARNPHAYRVVAGHSYGSTVAGYAASGPGLDADALVLLGSPGIPGTPILKSADPKLVAALGDKDPIGVVGTNHSAIHGIDPAAVGSGFERWRLAGDHSGYVDDPVFVGKLIGLMGK